MIGFKLAGCGMALPEKVVTNDDMAKIVETSDEWISTRTGIKERRFCSGGETVARLVNDNGTDIDSNASEMVVVENAESNHIVTVGNEPGAALPSTGGSGTRFFTILGSILILGAGVLLWRRRRLI